MADLHWAGEEGEDTMSFPDKPDSNPRKPSSIQNGQIQGGCSWYCPALEDFYTGLSDVLNVWARVHDK